MQHRSRHPLTRRPTIGLMALVVLLVSFSPMFGADLLRAAAANTLDMSYVTLSSGLTTTLKRLLASPHAVALGGSRYAITSARLEGDWAFLSLGILDGPNGAEEYLGFESSGSLIVAQRVGADKWDAALMDTPGFAALMARLPDHVATAAEKASLAGSNTNLAAVVNYKFPWANEVYGWLTTARSQMWHGGNTISKGLDFFPMGDWRVLVSATGQITNICVGTLSVNVTIRADDGLSMGYAHLEKNGFDTALLGKRVQQGTVLGVLKPGTWTDTKCASRTEQSNRSAHIHWSVPSTQALVVDSWTIRYPDNYLAQGTTRQGPGGYFRSSNSYMSSTPPPASPPLISQPYGTECLKPVLRYWNKPISKHLYTTDWTELGTGKNGWIYERVEGYVATSADCYAPGGRPLFRLYNASTQKHFYTATVSERDYAISQLGFKREVDVGFLLGAANTTFHTAPLYRLYRPQSDDHFYTTNSAEKSNAVSVHGYRDEGIVGYVFGPEALRPPETACLKPLLRYWNKEIKKHFYTSDWGELGVGKNSWMLEWPEGYVAVSKACVPSSNPIFRLYNASQRAHFYTLDPAERDKAISQSGFVREPDVGFALASPDLSRETLPLYRLLNDTTKDYFYTTSASERDTAIAIHGYHEETMLGYVFSAPRETPLPPRSPWFSSDFAYGAPGSSFVMAAGELGAGTKLRISLRTPGTITFRSLTSLVVPTTGDVMFIFLTTADMPLGTYTLRTELEQSAGLMAVEPLEASVELAANAPVHDDFTVEPIQRVEPGTVLFQVALPLIQR